MRQRKWHDEKKKKNCGRETENSMTGDCDEKKNKRKCGEIGRSRQKNMYRWIRSEKRTGKEKNG